MQTATSPAPAYTCDTWTVPSASTPGLAYLVSIDLQTSLFRCGCPDHESRQRDCKHSRQIYGRLGIRPAATTLLPAARALQRSDARIVTCPVGVSLWPGVPLTGVDAMTTATPTRNGHVATIEQVDPALDLERWEEQITALDRSMREAAAARRDLDEQTAILERIEASKVLEIAGPNEAARRARLTLELADDARYLATVRAIDEQRMRLMMAERRAELLRERCKLLRAALALRSGE